MRRLPLLSLLAVCVALAAPADTLREVGAGQARVAVQDGKGISVRRALKLIGRIASGEVVDVRAFQGRALFYRVLLLKPSGKVFSYIVDASSGHLLPVHSSAAREVESYATEGSSPASSAAAAQGGRNGGGGGNAGGKGNGGGNGNANGGNGNGGSGNGHGGGRSNSGR